LAAAPPSPQPLQQPRCCCGRRTRHGLTSSSACAALVGLFCGAGMQLRVRFTAVPCWLLQCVSVPAHCSRWLFAFPWRPTGPFCAFCAAVDLCIILVGPQRETRRLPSRAGRTLAVFSLLSAHSRLGVKS
jgi:hypothetical protein